jgi:DNA-binding transcriptional ArsR family regulator
MTFYASRAAADAAAERLKVYAQPQRLMILSRLLDGARTVGEIEAATGIAQPALSQQLAELRRADLVRSRRSSKQVYYTLADDDVATCVRGIEALFGTSGNAGTALREMVKWPRGQRLLGRPTVAAAFARIEP